MKHLGFISKTIDWFVSYVKKRNIVVSLEKTLSETRILNFDFPQWSILGSYTIFIICKRHENSIKELRPSVGIWIL